jgi:hypothetical protein
MEAYLRRWQANALERQMWESAIFVGDKLLALTSEHLASIIVGEHSDSS